MGFKQRGGLNLWLGFWEDSYFLETGGVGSGQDIRDGERCGVPVVSWELEGITSHLKMDGWKMKFPFGFRPNFQVWTVSFRECTILKPQKDDCIYWSFNWHHVISLVNMMDIRTLILANLEMWVGWPIRPIRWDYDIQAATSCYLTWI